MQYRSVKVVCRIFRCLEMLHYNVSTFLQKAEKEQNKRQINTYIYLCLSVVLFNKSQLM